MGKASRRKRERRDPSTTITLPRYVWEGRLGPDDVIIAPSTGERVRLIGYGPGGMPDFAVDGQHFPWSADAVEKWMQAATELGTRITIGDAYSEEKP